MPNSPSKAFVDSGTTFVFMSQTQKIQIDRAFMFLWESKVYNWLGERTRPNCYKFQPTKFFSVKDFYLSYPPIVFETQESGVIKWLASEYFYKDSSNDFWVSIDPYASNNEMIIGGSLMRQNMFVFDVENRKLGFARAKWSDDPDMIASDSEIYLVNNAKIDDKEWHEWVTNYLSDQPMFYILITLVRIQFRVSPYSV